MINKKTLAAGRLTCSDIAPTISNHIAFGQPDSMLTGSVQKKACLGFAAIAIVRINVRAHPDAVDCQFDLQSGVHPVENVAILLAGCYIRLIRDNDVEEPRLSRFQQGFRRSRKNFKFLQRYRREWLTVAHDGPGENPVSVPENGLAHNLSCYHLVASC